MEFGISSACFYPQLTEETVRQLAARGIRSAEVFINTFSELEPGYLRALRREADESGMRIRSIHPFGCAFDPFMLFTHYDRRLQDALDWHRRYFEAANLLGAEVFVFHGDRWREPPARSVCSDEDYFQRFALLRDLGKEYGVTVAQENVSRCRSKDVDFLERMGACLGGDMALVFDNKQALRSGVDWRQFLERLGHYVAHVHISGSGPEGDCLPLRQEDPELEGILSALHRQGFDGAVMVELYGEHMDSAAPIYDSYRCLLEAGRPYQT